jgi:murein DD-endopeptidase MepM/ murein hydrolase activator NlpD
LKNGLITAGEKLLLRAAHALEHHPKHVTALVAAVLLGGGGGAYAVASFGPDPSSLPVQEIMETVEPLPVLQQTEALDVHSFQLFRSEITRTSDTVEALLSRMGVSDPAAAAYLRNDQIFRSQLLGRAGRTVTVEATPGHGLSRLTARWPAQEDGQFKRLLIERGSSGQFVSRVDSGAFTASARLGSGTIRTSLFAAVDDARIPDEVAMQVADIFSARIDFHRGLRRGDRFHVVYEALEADGEPMRTGRVLSVEFVNNGKLHQAVWFQQPGQKGGYYDMEGKSLTSSYLASPMEFSRVTSGFAMRFHPILQQWKAHLGVDYGAPTGTPVRSVGDGVVDFAGVQNGFGNVVIVKHNNSDITLYAHLSRIDVRPGQHVDQAQRVGAVGSTGWATGPHLHFEFRINGTHQDPLEVARKTEGVVLSAAVRPAFDRVARSMGAQLAASASSLTASAQ